MHLFTIGNNKEKCHFSLLLFTAVPVLFIMCTNKDSNLISINLYPLKDLSITFQIYSQCSHSFIIRDYLCCNCLVWSFSFLCS